MKKREKRIDAKKQEKKAEITVLTPNKEKPFTVARKWTEQVARMMEKSEKNARIYVCSGEVETDLRQGATVYNYVYASEKRQIYLMGACSSYDERLKVKQLVERFLEMYPTPLILQKDMQFLANFMAKQLK